MLLQAAAMRLRRVAKAKEAVKEARADHREAAVKPADRARRFVKPF